MATGECLGFLFDLFDDDDDLSRYKCSICNLVSRDPQQATCCYSTFCKACLDLHLEQSSKQHTKCPRCPACKEPLHYFKDGKLNREIKALTFYCINEGCKWKGNATEREAHYNSCPYEMMLCTNKCRRKIRRSEMKTHLREKCIKRQVHCEYCNKRGPHNVITGKKHTDECPDYPVKCSNEECSRNMPRRLLAFHIEACPKAMITCKYNTVGCNKIMKREEKYKHEKESMQHHLELAMKRIDTRKLPTHIKFEQCTEKMKDEVCFSPDFYTSPEGYKMCLGIYLNGNNDGKGTHVSCYIYLMTGKYDDTLEWPFHGEVTIELLNQLEDKNHKKSIVSFDAFTGDIYKQRVTGGMAIAGKGENKFIPHSELAYNSITNCQYLKNDTLFFKISVA